MHLYIDVKKCEHSHRHTTQIIKIKHRAKHSHGHTTPTKKKCQHQRNSFRPTTQTLAHKHTNRTKLTPRETIKTSVRMKVCVADVRKSIKCLFACTLYIPTEE